MNFCTLKSLLKVKLPTSDAKYLVKLLFRSSSSTAPKDTCKEVHTNVLTDPAQNTAIITGGTGGIGFATASHLLANDARVVILIGPDPKKGLDSVRDLNCYYGKGKAVFVKGDVRNKSEVEDILKELKREYGKLSIIVNCAGIWNEREWEAEVAVNFTGIINTSLAAERFLHRKDGVVINLAGIFGLQPFPPSPILAALHSGVLQFSKSLGHHINFKRIGIRYIALCPGITQTDFSKDVEKRMLSSKQGKDLEQILKHAHRQKPDVCAKSVLELIRYGQSGTTWVIEGSRLFSLELPDWKKHCKLVSQYT